MQKNFFLRNGGFLQFDGGSVQEATEKQLQKWLTSEETLHIIGVIDEVNMKMLNNILEAEDHCFVFFYAEKDPDAHAILTELEGLTFSIISYLVSKMFIEKREKNTMRSE